MDKDKKQDRIDEYLLGKGSPEARREFEEETSRNEELSRALGDTELALAAIELAEDEALKMRLQGLEQRLAAATPGSTVDAPLTAAAPRPKAEARVVEIRRRRKGQFRLLGYAAALLLMLAVGWWAINQPGGLDTQQLAMDSFTPYENIATGTVRGDNDDTAEAAAFADYDAGNYAAAAEKFSALSASNSFVNNFYLGQSLLAQQKFEEAARVFSPLMSTPAFPLAEEAAYYHALALLGTGDAAGAKTALAKISNATDHEMQAEAKALLAKLLQ
jgi:TolA-binding protein